MDRRDKILKRIDINGKGLEIGPLCWPILTKEEANIFYVDHTSTTQLKKLYGNDDGVDKSQIVDVDFPLEGKSISEAVGKQNTFDYVIASHVMEHVPDMIGWLNDISKVLKVGGTLSLAIPDKRFTFDIDRNPSEPGEVIGAYLDKYKRPPSSTIYDYASNRRSNIDATAVWDGELYLGSKAHHSYSPQQALEMCEENKHSYVDTHCFVYTPYSFFEIVTKLVELDLIKFKVVAFFPTEPGSYEFLVSLERINNKVKRQSILDSIPTVGRQPYTREYEAKIRDLEKSIQTKEAELHTIKSELNNVLSSKSWQLTKPVRGGVKITKKIIRK